MTQEDEAEELNALKDEQDMPIEELLKMYGYNKDAAKDAAKDPAEAGPSEAGAAEEAEVDAEDDEEEEEDGDDEEKAEVEKVADEEKEEKGEELVTQGEKRGPGSPPPAKKSRSELAKFYDEEKT